MDSDDSRDSSSEDESTKGTPKSGSKSRSQSRSVSPNSNKSGHSSRSSSPENGKSSDSERSASQSRPQSPKSVSPCSRNSVASNSPVRSYSKSPDLTSPNSMDKGLKSPGINIKSRSPSPGVNIKDTKKIEGLRSPSPVHSENSSCPSSPECKTKSPDRSSIKSASSGSSKKSKLSDHLSTRSNSSKASRRSSKISRASRRKSDGNSSDSSSSSAESSNRKNISSNVDVQPEEISDGDIESDVEKLSDNETKRNESSKGASDIKISHEDLSDVSDLEDSMDHSEDDKIEENKDTKENNEMGEVNQKIETEVIRTIDKPCKNENEDVEEQLDFEAEDGECGEIDEPKKGDNADKDGPSEPLEEGEAEADKEDEKEEKKDLEEGELSDEDDARPEETEPRPVCRFFSRGQCTWGASCRFLHPGVTDKGHYTMFEMVRPLVPGEFSGGGGGGDRFMGRPEPPPIESAWERGLRTAKEMVRKSLKRKEQDIDFEEKKMNLSLAQEEFDKENGYYVRVPSPEPRYVGRHAPVEFPPPRPPPEEYYNRRQVVYEPEFIAPRERVRPAYRELPTHKMPDYYNNKYEEETSNKRKPKREVIVQRVEREKEREREERPSRADEWSDPWMRSKSPAGKRSGRKRSYSSGSSYSSSSSTHSSSSHSSYRSRSPSNSHKRKVSHSKRGRHVSPSVIVSERKAANERAAMMNPPAPRKRAPSPGMLRAVTAANPPPPIDQFGRTRSKLAVAAALARARNRRRSSKSSSDSSGSSSSDSDSSGSSSSTSRDGSPPTRRSGDLSLAKAMDVLKGSSAEKRQIKLNLKASLGSRKPELVELARKADQVQSKKRPANSPPSTSEPKNKKTASRREELLKQLKAVEDAIAKKRSKVN